MQGGEKRQTSSLILSGTWPLTRDARPDPRAQHRSHHGLLDEVPGLGWRKARTLGWTFVNFELLLLVAKEMRYVVSATP